VVKITLLEFSLLVFVATVFKCSSGRMDYLVGMGKRAKHSAIWREYVRKLTACKLYFGRLWIGIIWLKKGLVTICSVHVNEISFSSEYREFVCSLQFLRLP